MECGPACSSVCGNHGSTVCKDACIDGCHCPPGTALAGDRCVHEDKCPCEHNGDTYEHGVEVAMGCETWLV